MTARRAHEVPPPERLRQSVIAGVVGRKERRSLGPGPRENGMKLPEQEWADWVREQMKTGKQKKEWGWDLRGLGGGGGGDGEGEGSVGSKHILYQNEHHTIVMY